MRVIDQFASAAPIEDHRGGETTWGRSNAVFLKRDTLVLVLEPETIAGWCGVAIAGVPGRYAVLSTSLGEL